MVSRIGIVIPAGPGEDVQDTISSVLAFAGSELKVVIVNDSGRDYASASLPGIGAKVAVVPAPSQAPGRFGGLWVKITAGLRTLLANYEPDVILRMDTDALMIGSGFADAACRALAEDPKLGILGAVAVSPDGGKRDWSPAARQLASEGGLRGLRHPRLNRELRRRLREANEHGYVAGEHALGGAYVLSPAFALWLCSPSSQLDHRVFAPSNLGEDHIAGLLCRSAGFSLRDFSGPGDPMAVKWRGLPASPESLLASNVCVVHSVRFFDGRSEEDIRSVFRHARETVNPV